VLGLHCKFRFAEINGLPYVNVFTKISRKLVFQHHSQSTLQTCDNENSQDCFVFKDWRLAGSSKYQPN
jgi:hypothetical protein